MDWMPRRLSGIALRRVVRRHPIHVSSHAWQTKELLKGRDLWVCSALLCCRLGRINESRQGVPLHAVSQCCDEEETIWVGRTLTHSHITFGVRLLVRLRCKWRGSS